MKASVLSKEAASGERPVVLGLSYDLRNLTVIFDPDAGGAILEVVFDVVRGFRCLDEGDLQDLWDDELMVEHWLFEINEGGWLDHEATRAGFISKDLGLREFLVRGHDDCVSVICAEPPAVREMSRCNSFD